MRPVCVALLLLASAAAPAMAGPCEQGLAPIPGSDGYRERGAGARCEGLFVSPVSGAALEVVSFTDAPLRYDLGPSATLAISLTGPTPGNATVHVRAIGIPDGLFYRLDADLAPGQTLAWPVGEVLIPDRIPPEQVGVLALLRDASGRTVYLPVHAAQPGSRSTGGGLLLVLRPLAELGDPQWRYLAGPSATPYQALATQRNRMEIVLPAVAGSRPGIVQVVWNDPATGTSRTTRFALGG